MMNKLTFFFQRKRFFSVDLMRCSFIVIIYGTHPKKAFNLFFLKNLFRYTAMYFLAFLRTGMVKDIQDELYHKTVDLPISYFSEEFIFIVREKDIILLS